MTERQSTGGGVGWDFIVHARCRLNEDYFPKLQKCVDLLSEDDLWWRPNDSSNSVGNILLHLCGNLRQWIVHGGGGEVDIRQRPEEFAERGPISKDELMGKLSSILQQVDDTLAKFDPTDLSEPRTVQGFDETCLTIIFHAVEHFAQHLGQIVYITKMRKNIDLKFFDL